LPQLETVALEEYGIGRRKNEPLSIWYGQPILQFNQTPPFVPQAGPQASGLQLLKAILEHSDFKHSDCKPAIVVLPELAIPYSEIGTARALIASAPKGTLVVFGAGQMTEAEALSLEAKPDLWDGGAAGRFANCAVICVGGTDKVFLQPKLLKSALEQDWHWPGRVVRCFTGEYLRFATFICSDLLNRPGDSSYLAWLHEELERHQHKLTFAVWLQHNAKPRSDQFSNAIDAVGKMERTTIIVAGSRVAEGGRRFENYAVSGAFAVRTVFPSEFSKFTHRFHYAEQADANVSRAVLLRYDADAYRVRTVLADALDAEDKVEKGELFDSSQPYVFDTGTLTASPEHLHIRDLCEPARRAVATATPDLGPAADAIASKLTQLGTTAFLSFLDVGIVPQAQDGEVTHPAGTKHQGGDLRCRCWKHRTCIDLLTEASGVEPLTAIIDVLAVLEDGQCSPSPRHDHVRRTNVDLTIAGSKRAAAIVYPFDYTFDALQKKLFGERPPVLETHFLFVAEILQQRPKVDTINVTEAPTAGAVDPARTGAPTIAPVRAVDLKRAAAVGDLADFLGRALATEAR
jgi:hypothetical protein